MKQLGVGICSLLFGLLSGCTPCRPPCPVPLDPLPEAAVVRPAAPSVPPADEAAELSLSLADAIQLALRSSPRLRAADANLERQRGYEQAAFAPFLPQLDLMNRAVETSPNQSPGTPGIVGGVLGTGDALHSFAQSELQIQWTLYDFGRTTGRYRQAGAREWIAAL